MMMLSPLEELRDRANAEFAEYCAEVLEKSSEEILEQSYKKVILEDFLCVIENEELSDMAQQTLFEKKYPLEALYQEWLGNDYSHMDLLRDTIDDFAQHVPTVAQLETKVAQDKQMPLSVLSCAAQNKHTFAEEKPKKAQTKGARDAR